MQRNRPLTKGHMLARVATLACLMAIVGCSPGADRDDGSRPASDPTLTPGVAGDPGRARGDDRTPELTPVAARDQRVAGPHGESSAVAQYPRVESASAQIYARSGSSVQGTVTFTAGDDGRGMRVTVALEGLEASGRHGFHVHEVGDCSADDASSAGDHFNPHGAPHGSPHDGEHHVGDMGNLEADDEGRVSAELAFPYLALSGPASIRGRAVVVHRNADDLTSQPAGDAGGRVGCGVIRMDSEGLAQ